MYRYRSSWLSWIGVLGLIFTLAACGGTTNQPTDTTTATPHTTSTPSSSGSTTTPTIPTTSTVSFTASGGLTGTYTVSDTSRASNYGKALAFIIQGQSWLFTLSYSDYTGLGTHTFTFNATRPPWGSVALVSVGGTKRWELTPPATCQVTVTGDTTLSSQFHEVKGSFSCPSLVSQPASTTAPLTLTNGQFDIVALVVPT